MCALAIAYALLPKVGTPKLITVKSTLIAWKHILSKSKELGELIKIPVPLRVLEYCRARISVNNWISQGFNYYVNLPLAYKELVLKNIDILKD